MNWTHTLRIQTQQHLEHAVQLFNTGEFYEAHESFEKLWRNAEAEQRQFFQGLVQVAVAFHFRSEQNLAGALGMLDLATRNLASYAGECHGLQLTALLCTLSAWRKALLEQSSLSSLPRIEVHRGAVEAKRHDSGAPSRRVSSLPRTVSDKGGSAEFAALEYAARDIKLAVWHSRTAMSSSKAAAFYEDLLDEQRVPLGEEAKVYAFYNELCSRYPENEMLPQDEFEDSPWGCAHERSGIHVLMTVRQERSAEVIPVILELAQKHRLLCFDPQTQKVFSPPPIETAISCPASPQVSARSY